jgi:hypothetical protein
MKNFLYHLMAARQDLNARLKNRFKVGLDGRRFRAHVSTFARNKENQDVR